MGSGATPSRCTGFDGECASPSSPRCSSSRLFLAHALVCHRSVDSFERNLENVQNEHGIDAGGYVPVLYKTEADAGTLMSVASWVLPIVFFVWLFRRAGSAMDRWVVRAVKDQVECLALEIPPLVLSKRMLAPHSSRSIDLGLGADRFILLLFFFQRCCRM